MENPIDIECAQVVRELGLPQDIVQRTVTLLDDGNTVPFITRFRKDQTGALDEQQVRSIQEKVGKVRALEERKQTVLKSIQTQGKLTASLTEQIRTANSPKRLEDLYLPYKPKKQTLATMARKRGLEPLAREVLHADPAAADLRQRAATLIAPDRDLQSVEEVLAGVGHILAEWFSERADLRGRLRKILYRTGKLVCRRQESPAARDKLSEATPPAAATGQSPQEGVVNEASSTAPEMASTDDSGAPPPSGSPGLEAASAPAEARIEPEAALTEPKQDPGSETSSTVPLAAGVTAETETPDSVAETPVEPLPREGQREDNAPAEEPSPVTSGAAEGQPGSDSGAALPASESEPSLATGHSATERPPLAVAAASKVVAKPGPLRAKMTKKEKKRQKLEAAFKDYFGFEESIGRLPPHRVLAINRGERARIVRAKIEADADAMAAEAERLLIPADHPHAEFLTVCIRDALNRLLIPSLERELRREMTERAESHAVAVFAQNLRKLLLQPPVHGHRILAIDPGFRSGCKLVALDEFGNVLAHDVIHVIGKDEWVQSGRGRLAEMVRQHRLSVIAIGNGSACRETEQLVVDIMARELQAEDVAFVIVNEAGASVYSTSPLGREELPQYDPVLRSAISIGRRLLDPLSELVKINPANIGVGMYQHDVKAKHLRDSLDAVVESCVNYVGVDVNTASPALLRYVSGLNQLTARRICEYRSEHGPFTNRAQLTQVPGFGETAFVQAAGFLKITNGDHPFDATWIHPESYTVASRVLEELGCSVDELSRRIPSPPARAPSPSPPPGDGSLDEGSAAEESPSPPATDQPTPPVAESVPAESPAVPEGSTDSPPVAGPSQDAATAELPSVAQPAASDERSVTEEAEASPSGSMTAEAAVDEPVESPQPTELETPEERAGLAESDLSAPSEVPHSAAGDEPLASDAVQTDTPRTAAPPQPEAAGPAGGAVPLDDRIEQFDLDRLAGELSVSTLLLQDILFSLRRPGRDPREDLPPPVFRRGIVKLEDLEPGMELSGTVLNVVDFGAFVDIGLSDSGLVHISRLADRFVKDPHEIVGVGDVIKVWVVEVDKGRRRVSLTAIEPGTERKHQPRSATGRRHPRKGGGGRQSGRGRQGQRPAKPEAGGKAPSAKRRTRPPRKPKIVTPITKEMEEGKEPLRSFSDLMQFYQKKQTDENESSP